MTSAAHLAQIVVAVAVGYVWIFRFDNIVHEFKHYGLNDLTRTMVGAAKLILATLLVVGIWYPALVLVPALVMALLMAAAQYFHFKVNNPMSKRLPSLVLMGLCLFIAAVALHFLS